MSLHFVFQIIKVKLFNILYLEIVSINKLKKNSDKIQIIIVEY